VEVLKFEKKNKMWHILLAVVFLLISMFFAQYFRWATTIEGWRFSPAQPVWAVSAGAGWNLRYSTKNCSNGSLKLSLFHMYR